MWDVWCKKIIPLFYECRGNETSDKKICDWYRISRSGIRKEWSKQKLYINQLIRSSNSVAANYRSVRRAKSKPDFINKLKIVEEELDENLLFLELLHEFNQSKRDKIINIHSDGDELLKIIVATINSSRN